MYQNELDQPSGLEPEAAAWLGNFGDNPLEYFSQYHVEFHPPRLEALRARLGTLQELLEAAPDDGISPEEGATRLGALQGEIDAIAAELERCSPENFARLPEREQRLHQRAFTVNTGDPDQRKLAAMEYQDGEELRDIAVPAGDLFHQFREDVDAGKLPVVSWLVAPENFSDHPSAPWYGAWYVSEALDILTRNPEVWKKTIFILCYDENDGYFDHVPPFSVPNPYKEDTGAVSAGIDCKTEYVTLEQDMTKKPEKESRESPIGLGYRVPLVVASPWNRGGNVCSEVFDHTSILQFLEKFVSHKSGKEIKETNISEWRRTICGDLTSTFLPYDGEEIKLPTFLEHDEFMEGIFNAQFKKLPKAHKALTPEEIKSVNKDPLGSTVLPKQEKGTRPACPIPYELSAEGALKSDKSAFEITLEAKNDMFKNKAAGSPFIVYAPTTYKNEAFKVWNYAVKAGDALKGSWKIADFKGGKYHLKVYGPNGFYREFTGTKDSGSVKVGLRYQNDKNKKSQAFAVFSLANLDTDKNAIFTVTDNAYGAGSKRINIQELSAGNEVRVPFDLKNNSNWYDFSITLEGQPDFLQRYAGHIETGYLSQSDPFMGQMLS